MLVLIKIVVLSGLFFVQSAIAGQVYETFPVQINSKASYVFYSHGLIVEGTNPRPVNARWGTYEFPKIKAALSDESYHLIAYQRPKNTNPHTYAKKLVTDINKLIEFGVPTKNIALVGFSRGGEITALASHYLRDNHIKVVIMAACAGLLKAEENIDVVGHIYSIYETSDSVGSCQFLIDRSKDVSSFKEVSITTGKEHGAFYRPMKEWLIPVKQWLNEGT